MPIEQTIRELCNQWAKKTYKQEVLLNKTLENDVREYVLNLFEALNIADVPMNGNSCEGLPKTDEQRIQLQRTYSDIFHTESLKENFSPASYLIEVTKECMSSNISEPRTIGALARGLRTFTSLLREPDFAEQIKNILYSEDKNVKASLNAKQDSSDHTDVLLTYKSQDYRIWLYQFSSRGLPHDIERLSGKRGKLPNGIHVICPLKTELAMDLTTYNKQLNTQKNKLLKTKEDLTLCSENAKSKRKTLEERLLKTNEKVTELEAKINSISKLVSEELDVIEGWFFYSHSHIKRIVQYIKTTTNPQSYEDVYKMLTAPEKFVGTINIFNKEKDYE